MAKGYAESGEKASERTRDMSRVSSFIGDELERIARDGAQRLLAEMLELEVTEFLQRARSERGNEHRGYRNGSAPERTIGVGLGALNVRVPRVSDVPQEVAPRGTGSLTGITAIAAGYYHGLAVKNDGTVWGWGYNGFGGLGNGTSGNTTSTPTQTVGVGGSGYLSGITAVAAGAYHSLAIKNDGTVFSWGYNSNGQLGNGTTTNSSTPLQVSGLSGITSLAGGGWHSVANAQVQPNPTATTSYGYDALYRLTSVNNGATAYTYDPVGNRLTKNATSYAYDRADRILTAGSTTYTVNANGNLVARGSDTFSYDQANRLTSATVSGTASSYVYDGDGKRASKTVGTTTTSYVYDVNTSLPNVLTDGSLKYVYGVGLTYAVDGSGNVQVYHTDGLGSVRAITDANGNVIRTCQWGTFVTALLHWRWRGCCYIRHGAVQ